MARNILAFAVFALVFLAVGEAHAGYTHYWKWRAVPDAATLEIAVTEMNKLAIERRAILSDWEGRTGTAADFRDFCEWGTTRSDGGEDGGDGGDGGAESKRTPCILFNGIGDMQHETFGFPLAPFTNNPDFSFVKTANKPYDEVAAACLIVAHDHFPDALLEISSDGTWPEDFSACAKLYEKVLGRPAHNPLTPHGVDASADPEPAPLAELTTKQLAIRWGVFGLLAIVVVVALLARGRR